MTHLLQLLILFSSYRLAIQPSPQKLIIRGMVVDSISNKAIPFATIVLTDKKTGQVVLSSSTGDDGVFELTAPANRVYELALTSVGYLSRRLSIPLIDSAQKDSGRDGPANSPTMDLGKVMMTGLSGQLTEVSIVAARPVMKQEIDRISYDVQADPESKSNDGLEMLRKVPMITIDGNNIIQLKGSSSFQIYINGKPSALMANNPADVLKAMDAASIQRIEVITVPPAKYEGEGLTGIINIITFKKNTDGFTGSLFARFNNINGERGSASFRAKKGKFGFNTFLGLGRSPLRSTATESQLSTFASGITQSQRGQSAYGGHFNNGQAELSYEIDSLHLLTGSVDFVNRKFTQNTFLYSQQSVKSTDSIAQSYQLTNIGRNSIGALDAGVSYQIGYRKDKNELLTLAYQYTAARNDQTNAITAANGYNYTGSAYNQQNSTRTRDQAFQLDFVKPVRKLIIEAGSKALFRNNSSNFGDQNLEPTTGQYTVDTSLTNEFRYHQNVYSIYNSYQLRLTVWTFKAGLRAENTDIGGSLHTGNTSLSQHYINLIPALSIQRSSGKSDNFTLGFTDRIERPVIKQLNPFVDRSNPELVVTGNPNLRPVLNHIIEVGYSRSSRIPVNASINYAFSNNAIQNVTSLVSDTISETTFSNLGKNQSAGINLSTNIPFSDKIHVGLNAQLSHLWVTGIYNSQYYKNDGNQGNMSLLAKYNAGPDCTVNVNIGYFSGNVLLQGKTSDYVFSTLNITRDCLRKKAAVSFTLYNPFATYNYYSSYTRTPDFYQSGNNQNYYRNLRLAFNYKFGQLNGNVRKNRPGKNEDTPASEPER